MVYLIGGLARSGKSIIRKKLLKEQIVSGIGTDAIRYMLMKGNRDLGISPDNFPTVNGPIMWPYLESLIEEFSGNSDEGIVIEGDVLLPQFLKNYAKNSNVRACFIGFANTTPALKATLIRNNATKNDWTNKYSEEGLLDLAKWGIDESRRYMKICKAIGVSYFDTGEDFNASIDMIAKELIRK